jgi:hypothetical protein
VEAAIFAQPSQFVGFGFMFAIGFVVKVAGVKSIFNQFIGNCAHRNGDRCFLERQTLLAIVIS